MFSGKKQHHIGLSVLGPFINMLFRVLLLLSDKLELETILIGVVGDFGFKICCREI